jgi:adenylate cyclase
MLHPAYAYLPADRLAALADQRELPLRASGAVLSVDVVGFTRITEAFASALGARRGAESLAELLNQVYASLIACVEKWHGIVVSFSGDAMRCWFAGDDGRGAVACAGQIQQSMQAIAIPAAAPLAVAVKAAIVSGEVQRFSLGDPAIQLIDTLAGSLLVRLADLEQIVQPGEIIVDEPAALALAALVRPGPRRSHPGSATVGIIVAGLMAEFAAVGAPIDVAGVTAAAAVDVQPWLLASIWERLQRGMGDFLTELRPVVALFGQFAGAIDVEDRAAVETLNRYVAWVQGVITRYDGVVLQITLGEKGNYFYAAFGALQAHEDDAVRAVCAARDLQAPATDSPIGAGLRVGLASGIMRTGVYGSPARRTYGVLGDAANLAARLMQHAQPGTILATQDVAAATADQAGWLILEPIMAKGKRDPLSVSRYSADRSSQSVRQPDQDQLPMIGRQAELEQLLGYLAEQPRQGHVIALNGEAGIGKSRLISEVAAAARRRGWLVYASECQSYLQNTPYSLWQPLLRALVGIEDSDPPDRQIARLETAIAAVNPAWLPRLPLLGPIVNLSIPDTELTRPFDAQLRNASREALAVDWLREWVRVQAASAPGIALVLEDIHWIDPLSLSLLAALSRVIGPLPVIVLLAHRPLETATLKDQLSNLSELTLGALSPEAAGAMITAKMIQLGQPLAPGELEPLASQVYARTQGNPFYIEELLIYLHENQQDPRDPQLWERSELPASLHQLLLSRIDQLSPTQQETLKIASVIGRLFRVAWLHDYHPALATRDVHADLGGLRAAEMILLDSVDPELIYLFRHVIAQEVAYETLAFATRELLHEQLAAYLECSAPALDDQRIYLIAYHYERSANQAKRRQYLLLAGKTAQAAYANAAAIRYYEAALPLLDDKDERAEILLRLGAVLELIADKPAALERYQQSLQTSQECQAVELVLQSYYALGVYYRIENDYDKALTMLNAGHALAIRVASPEQLKIESEIANLYFHQGDFDQAKQLLDQSLQRQSPADDPTAYAMTYFVRGNIAKMEGDFEKSYLYAQKVLEIHTKDRDILKYSDALNNLGNILTNHGELDRCLEVYEESLAIRRTIGAKRAISISLYNLGLIYLKKYQLETATTIFREALSIAMDIGDTHILVHSTRCLGDTLASRGEFAEAKGYFEQALEISETLDSGWMKCVMYTSMGTFNSLQGKFAEVEHFSRKALALYEEMNNPQGVAIALGNLGSNCVESGRYAEAREFLERVLAILDAADEQFLVVYTQYYLGFLAIEEGASAEAINCFKASLTLAKQITDGEGFMLAAIGLIAAQLRLGSSAEASEPLAVLLTAVEQTMAHTAAYLNPYMRGHFEQVSALIRQALPRERLAAARQRGGALSMDEAIDHALAIGG